MNDSELLVASWGERVMHSFSLQNALPKVYDGVQGQEYLKENSALRNWRMNESSDPPIL